MEWIKNMGLKKSLFTLALINLLMATVLSVFAFLGCMELRSSLTASGTQIVIGADTPVKVELPEPSKETVISENLLSVFQFALPALLYMISLIATASLFYRWKLEEPLAILTDRTTRIMENDLDFTIQAVSEDELGQLCTAFETMRRSLLDSNRKLWRQAEERKRLNAAFSHELRNPITVLKGSTKMAIQCVDNGNVLQLMDNITRIETYTGRIERYVETMSKVQNLEQLQPEKITVSAADLNVDMKKVLGFAVAESGKQLDYHGLPDTIKLTMDKEMLFQITENLTANALRFAKKAVSVIFSVEGDYLKLVIAEDGCGFPMELLENGNRPFHKGTEEADHFGMGLYICDLLCRKHGGSLKIANNATGAIVCVFLEIS